ncbi:MAG: 5-oxoprolinase subunit PxpB [Flavobacteriaceae bacterium]|nr:5-oxoprolinase subunit PxpB [Flavobacteriaceae bacterium]
MKPSIQPFGENAVLVSWEAIIDETIHNRVLALERRITEKHPNEVLETVYSYHSLAVYLKQGIPSKSFIPSIETALASLDATKPADKNHLITIPVCYEGKYALDIEDVARYHSISLEEVIRLHSQPIYKVYFLGFLPGFPYLGGLPEVLHTPRRDSPKSRVKKGSVGIGGNQTGIYPMDSPGGWNLIGSSPLAFFDPKRKPPSTIAPGDFIQFEPITQEEYEHTKTLVENGIYLLHKTPYHD